MGKIQVTGKIEEFLGRKLKSAIEFAGEGDGPATIDEAKAQGLWPNESQILEGLQSDVKIATRAKLYNGALKALREQWEKSKSKSRQDFIASMQANTGKTLKECTETADMVGMTGGDMDDLFVE